MHGELAAELSELPAQGVEGGEALAGVGLVLDDPQHVSDLGLSLGYCWVSRLGGWRRIQCTYIVGDGGGREREREKRRKGGGEREKEGRRGRER